MKTELYRNIDEYRQFINTVDTDPIGEMERYIRSGKYTSNLADLVIPMLSNVLDVCTVILNLDEADQTYKLMNKDRHVFRPKGKVEEIVYLKLNGYHYDSLIKKDDYKESHQTERSYKQKRAIKLTERMEASNTNLERLQKTEVR